MIFGNEAPNININIYINKNERLSTYFVFFPYNQLLKDSRFKKQ